MLAVAVLPTWSVEVTTTVCGPAASWQSSRQLKPVSALYVAARRAVYRLPTKGSSVVTPARGQYGPWMTETAGPTSMEQPTAPATWNGQDLRRHVDDERPVAGHDRPFGVARDHLPPVCAGRQELGRGERAARSRSRRPRRRRSRLSRPRSMRPRTRVAPADRSQVSVGVRVSTRASPTGEIRRERLSAAPPMPGSEREERDHSGAVRCHSKSHDRRSTCGRAEVARCTLVAVLPDFWPVARWRPPALRPPRRRTPSRSRSRGAGRGRPDRWPSARRTSAWRRGSGPSGCGSATSASTCPGRALRAT